MSPGPFILVNIISREPIEIGSRVLTVRARAARRFECVLEGVEAPTARHPSGRVRIRYPDGTITEPFPSFINATFAEVVPQ